MEPDKTALDDAQKAKIIFLAIAAVVTIILVWSLISAGSAKRQRDAALRDLDAAKQDNARLEQILKDQNRLIDQLRQKVHTLEARPKHAATAKKKKTRKRPAGRKSSKRSTRHTRRR